MRTYTDEKLDEEWVTLISIAKKLGLSKEEVKQFIASSSKN
ncbi:anti-repressor SinI family protein [Guptibacillus hwajinpoensis]|uniref:DNA-binding transcriptional MerR regulator n=1 Tax=Guptibacillus hwajinpoensis TaxID=208199 RepID=A0ABU0JZ88_9BACL|nr:MULTISPECIES: anti-repressor SinI family protein [Alkalihalobacillus]MDP4551591.1 anti-repressor SinI family protein [Alkalihalobacillus macyae]MDQ0482369.1 DNA-binding transcriptional MerR regulator [Alkalihalobacillus hemicentroti]